ncbi:Rod shape-determining protein MreC [Fulvivirga imtechensis AK7]|uniref:Cell shape-determining protein MreC n=1 Tax=Fulvivirga imtechensis AK7 TaxID=1237149 RepID=L8JWS3_9BACT|nr:rod shape-determining protein MreC [Fulvivirga imtechensis]ELR72648.1 Rod shape-determining protein MreC [Fulvivirga imtechensis AK7]
MQRLFLFLYQYRAFLTFLFLEVVCSWLIIENNDYQGAKFFNSSNRIAAGLLQSSNNISDYFGLKGVNEQLARENAELKEKLESLNQSLYDTSYIGPDSIVADIDSTVTHKYEFFSAKVINNSTRRFNNYITINKGKKHGVEPGMGVIGNDGVVGKVKTVSKHFAVITSILHGDVLVSTKVKRTGDLSTVKWGGVDPYVAELLYVPRHVNVQVGDTIVTSGYNAIFPEGVPVGLVKEVDLPEDALFYDITITLASDLNEISYVYLIRNKLRGEQDSLQINTELH